MADIFISYSKLDRAAALTVEAALAEAGYSVWWDRRLSPFDQWDVQIRDELDAAKAVVAIWTNHSVRSQWVRLEADHALKSGKLLSVRWTACQIPIQTSPELIHNLTDWPNALRGPHWQGVLDSLRAMTPPSGEQAGIPLQERDERIRKARDEQLRRLSAHPLDFLLDPLFVLPAVLALLPAINGILPQELVTQQSEDANAIVSALERLPSAQAHWGDWQTMPIEEVQCCAGLLASANFLSRARSSLAATVKDRLTPLWLAPAAVWLSYLLPPLAACALATTVGVAILLVAIVGRNAALRLVFAVFVAFALVFLPTGIFQ